MVYFGAEPGRLRAFLLGMWRWKEMRTGWHVCFSLWWLQLAIAVASGEYVRMAEEV